MKQRVVICRSNPISPDPRVEKEARALSAAGFSVQVVGWDRDGSLSEQEKRDGYSIYRCIIPAKYGHGMQNLPQLLRWQFGLVSWLLENRNEYDIIHACDFDTILPAIILRALAKKRVVYDIFDFYADHLRATPNLIKGIIRRFDLWVMNRVDAVILVDDARREQVDGATPRRIEIVYNSPEDWTTAHIEQETSTPAVFRVSYIGLLQVERGLLEVVDVVGRHPGWALELAGFGGDETQIREESRKHPNIRWHGRVAYEKALRLSADADVLFATYDPRIPNHRYSSPNKVFEAMMLGKPVIVAKNTNMDKIITEAECGLVVEYGDREGLCRAFEQLANDPGLRSSLGQNGRKAYQLHYGWEVMKARLINLYEDICCSEPLKSIR